jgi:hypothetical protein
VDRRSVHVMYPVIYSGVWGLLTFRRLGTGISEPLEMYSCSLSSLQFVQDDYCADFHSSLCYTLKHGKPNLNQVYEIYAILSGLLSFPGDCT